MALNTKLALAKYALIHAQQNNYRRFEIPLVGGFFLSLRVAYLSSDKTTWQSHSCGDVRVE